MILLALFSFLTIAPVPLADTIEQRELIAIIESKVQLPDGSWPIDKYSRLYAQAPGGEIIAVYVLPIESDSEENFNCDVLLIDGESRPCTDEEFAELEEERLAKVSYYGLAGESRWLKDYRELPVILDGGCGVVTITFNPSTNAIERIECNGEA